MNRLWIVAALAAIPLTALGAQDPQQQGQFRAVGRTVPIYATVTDRNGQPIEGLTREDFEVRDNGRVQTISQFSTDNAPLSALVLVDGSSSMMQSFDHIISGASSFVVRMLPEDRGRIGGFSERLRLSPRFTSDRDELLDYLSDQFNLVVGLATHLWHSMREAVGVLTEEQSKRVLLVLSDGHNWVAPGQTVYRGRLSSLAIQRGPGTTEADVMREAQRHDVIVYAVSVWTWFNGELQTPSPRLKNLALETGGGYFDLREHDEINATFTQIARELRQGYVLGFAPQELDGKTHRIEVKVGRKDATVHARRSYVAEAR